MFFRRSSDEPRSMLLPPDYEARRSAARRHRLQAIVRSPWLRGVCAGVFLVAVISRPVPAAASFSALLTQTIAYVNILIDEWEKHSRILEDHLDRVSGVMQPFSELHAGVRELTDTRGIRSLLRVGQAYRASILDPSCFTGPRLMGTAPPCTLVQDFLPPEVGGVYMDGVYAVDAAAYTPQALEQYAHSAAAGGWRTVRDVLSVIPHPLAQATVDTGTRVERNIWRNAWQMRRIRSLANRSQYVGSQYLYSARLDPATGCPDVDIATDGTVLDQARGADCLDPAAHVGSPLEESSAHLSSGEADTLQTASMFGIVDQQVIELEHAALQVERRNASEQRAEARRRRRLQRVEHTFDCLATGEATLAYNDGAGACAARGALGDVTIPDPAATFNAAMAEECRVPLNPRAAPC